MNTANLVEVEFETSMGAVYKFPDMEASAVDSALAQLSGQPQFTLANVSRACLILPTRIIQKIRVNGVEKWQK